MTNDMKPTVEMILQRKVAGNSVPHVMWSDAKKKASKVVDVSVFKGGLGPALDGLNATCKGALEVKKYYPKLDDRTLKPVRERRAKVAKVVHEYKQICKREVAKPGVSAVQKKAWGLLEDSATMAGVKADLMVKGIL